MSNRFDPIKVPPRWLNCPRKSNSLIADKFVAFKVPLSVKFNPNVPAECRFNMSMLLDSVKRTYNAKIGLIIDLTNTDRFYDSESEVKQLAVRHVKIKCKGHGETPSEDDVNLFLSIVESFVRQNPLDKIGVHCTHGFNRTGFMICAYMVEKLDFSIDMAVSIFGEARPPGIYKEEYVQELFRRYADPSLQMPPVPELPTWDQEDDGDVARANNGGGDYDEEHDGGDEERDDVGASASSSSSDDIRTRPPKKRQRREESKLNPKFADPELRGVEACPDPDEVARVRRATQEICNWNGAGFAGAQPVSMDQQNIRHLYQKNYMVSWKADGTRYLMYINGRDRVYMLDRDNSVFSVQNVSFPHRKNIDTHLENTLIDGEFVVDKDPITNQGIPRFLIYDIIKFERDDVGKMSFNIRMKCIDNEIILPRNEAIKQGKINKQYEPFSIRKKSFFPLSDTKKLLSPEFEKQITHGIDGLIYQPVDEPYKGGRCDTILKWKPPSQNSVDFRLEIVVKEQYGGLPEKLGYLYVNGYEMPFSTIRITKSISQLHGKIIECKWGSATNQWEFMRERVDKSYPNHVSTARAVCESIKHPITEERLIQIVKEIESRRMPPPPPPPPTSATTNRSSH